MPEKYRSELLHEVDLAREDEEDEDFIPAKKANKRKMLVPLYVYMILKDHTSPGRHFTYSEILRRLEEYPYEITIERKALGRIIHMLEEEETLGIINTRNDGTWHDPHKLMNLYSECAGA